MFTFRGRSWGKVCFNGTVKLGRLEVNEGDLKRLCAKWRIQKLEAFGSVLRDDFTPDSDVDLLVSFAPDAKWSYFDLDKAASPTSCGIPSIPSLSSG